ncbi:hypothetical protein BDN72DRAFT_959059 [Pluteus cervinus]|uniref:Uncharacterized protein n=1 Tax=Pluteus cervinus TaxID=181527 RepID=A0ACD3AWG9_9AGAR|nr:hypothetical protein BDN72DRAFT_959059 [Pluteus cervinus]
MAAFPAEIVESFLFYLDTGKDKETSLVSCAQVSQTWRSIAQRLLFAEVKITAQSSKAEAFANAITGSPHLSQLVNKLTFDVDNCTAPPLKSTLDILQTLVHVRDLHFVKDSDVREFFPTSSTGDAVWHPDLISALRITLSSPLLTNLGLSSLTLFPVSLFASCTGLVHLVIDHCTFNGLDDVVTTSSPKAQPKAFWFATTVSRQAEFELLEWMMKPSAVLDLSQVEQLFVSNTSEEPRSYEIVCKFIAMVGPSIKQLLTGPSWDVPTTTFPAARLVKLNTLDISILPRNETNAVEWAVNVLSCLAEPGLLEELTLQYRAPRASHIPELEPLDGCLSSGRFRNLKDLLVMLYITPEQDGPALVSMLRGMFPTLRTGCLRVNTYLTSGPLLA